MAEKIILKETPGAKIAIGHNFVLFVDNDGNPHVFSNNSVEAYRRKSKLQYEGYISEKDMRRVKVDLSEINEKCTDTWCDHITFGFKGESGKYYYWYTTTYYHSGTERYEFGYNLELLNNENIKASIRLSGGGGTLSQKRIVLFNDGTLHSWNGEFKDNYLKEYEIDFTDESVYDDIDIPDELLVEDVKGIYKFSENSFLAIDEEDKCHWVGEDVPPEIKKLTDLSEYSRIIVVGIFSGVVAIKNDGRIELFVAKGSTPYRDFALAKRYLKNIVDIDMIVEKNGYPVSTDVILAVNKDGKIMIWEGHDGGGIFTSGVENYEKIIPSEFRWG